MELMESRQSHVATRFNYDDDTNSAMHYGKLVKQSSMNSFFNVNDFIESSTLVPDPDNVAESMTAASAIIIVKSFVFGFIILAAIFGNMLVMVSVMQHRKLRCDSHFIGDGRCAGSLYLFTLVSFTESSRTTSWCRWRWPICWWRCAPCHSMHLSNWIRANGCLDQQCAIYGTVSMSISPRPVYYICAAYQSTAIMPSCSRSTIPW